MNEYVPPLAILQLRAGVCATCIAKAKKCRDHKSRIAADERFLRTSFPNRKAWKGNASARMSKRLLIKHNKQSSRDYAFRFSNTRLEDQVGVQAPAGRNDPAMDALIHFIITSVAFQNCRTQNNFSKVCWSCYQISCYTPSNINKWNC